MISKINRYVNIHQNSEFKFQIKRKIVILSCLRNKIKETQKPKTRIVIYEENMRFSYVKNDDIN